MESRPCASLRARNPDLSTPAEVSSAFRPTARMKLEILVEAAADGLKVAGEEFAKRGAIAGRPCVKPARYALQILFGEFCHLHQVS